MDSKHGDITMKSQTQSPPHEAHVDLLSVLAFCEDGSTEKQRIIAEKPFAKELSENTLVVGKLNFFELEQAICTASYLCLNTDALVEEFVWKIGKDRKRCKRYFVQQKNGTWCLNRKISNNVIYSELKQRYSGTFHGEKINVRFNHIHAARCLRLGNSRLFLRYGNSEAFQRRFDKEREFYPSIAAQAGQFETMICLHKNGFALGLGCMIAAAQKGNLEALTYLVENKCAEFPSYVMKYAIEGGNIDCVKYLKQQGCALNYHDLETAIKCGNLEILKFVHTTGAFDLRKWRLSDVCTLEILMYLCENGTSLENACHYPAGVGDLKSVMYAHSHGGILDAHTVEDAAAGGYIDILKYAIENGASLTKHACVCAAAHQHLDCLKFLHEHGCEWTAAVCSEAAGRGNLEMLKYAHTHECEWNAKTCFAAVIRQHTECLEYALMNGCECDERTIAALADYGSLEQIKTMREHGCPWDKHIFTGLIRRGYLECLMYVHSQGCELPDWTCKHACEHGSLDVLEYAVKHGCKWTLDDCIRAEQREHFDCMWYLIDQGCEYIPGSYKEEFQSDDESNY